MTTNKVSSESPFYFQLIHINNIWNIKTVFMQNGYRLQWYGIFPPFLIQYLAQLGLLFKLIHVQNKPFTIYITERSENTQGRVDPGRVDSGADLTSGRVDPLP